jgi:hypothetical protein
MRYAQVADSWLDLCYNPQALDSYFSAPPSLDRFEIDELTISRHNASLYLGGIIPERADKYLARGGDARADGAELTLCFRELSECLIEGPLRDQVGPLRLLRGGEGGVIFDFHSDTLVFHGTAGYVEIVGFHPVALDPNLPRAPRLTSDHKVWNSCLLWARSKGFALRMFGPPDEHGTSVRCSWQATKDDGTELTGGSPIELAGLIALHEHHRPDQNREYWWMIEGEDVVTQLRDQWEAKTFGPRRKQTDGPD